MQISEGKLYDLVYNSKNYQEEADQIRAYIKKINPTAQSILDVACGTGQHIQYLTNEYYVDGLDINASYLQLAQKRNPQSTFWCADMRSFDLSKKYDIVTCLFSAVAYANEYNKLVEAIKCMKNHVQVKGYLVIEPWFTPESWQRGYISLVQSEEDGLFVSRMSHSETQGRLSILNFEYLIGTSDGIEHFSEKHELALYSHEEMMQAFTEAEVKAKYDPVGITGRGIYIGEVFQEAGNSV